jgi:hypothetical protein
MEGKSTNKNQKIELHFLNIYNILFGPGFGCGAPPTQTITAKPTTRQSRWSPQQLSAQRHKLLQGHHDDHREGHYMRTFQLLTTFLKKKPTESGQFTHGQNNKPIAT